MKKLLVVLLILSVAGGMFAADVGDGFTITGEVKSGFGVFSQDDGNDDNGDDTYIQAWNNDAGNAFRFRVNLGWAGDVGGTKFRLQARDDQEGAYVTLPKAFGWVNLLDKKIVIWGGHGVDNLYGTGGIVDDNVDGEADLVRLEVRPIDGLSLSFGVPIPILGGSKAITYNANTYNAEYSNKLSLGNTFGASRFGAKFSNDTLTASVSARLNPGFKGTYYDVNVTGGDNAPGYVGQNELTSDQEVDGFVELLYAVQVPTILPVGIDVTGALQTGDAGYFRIAPKVTYALDKLDAHVQGDINVFIGDDTKVKAPGTGYSNFGNYEKIGDASIGVELGAGYQITDLIGAYLNVGSDNIAAIDGNGFYAKPGATFAFGPNTNIEVFDKISNLGADDALAWGPGKIANQLQVEFVWSF
jgi:hypothetical protein